MIVGSVANVLCGSGGLLPNFNEIGAVRLVKDTKNIASCGKVGVQVGDHGDVARNGEKGKRKQNVLRDGAVGKGWRPLDRLGMRY